MSKIIPENTKYIQCRQHQFSVETLQEEQVQKDIVFLAGSTFPEIQNGDIFLTEDYKYTYNENFGWNVQVRNRYKENYEKIMPTVNGKRVRTLNETFRDCHLLKISPVIPSTITDMYATFSGCERLKEAPIIPNSVTSMILTFDGCISLKEPPEIPDSVKDVTQCFNHCSFKFKLKTNEEDIFKDLV